MDDLKVSKQLNQCCLWHAVPWVLNLLEKVPQEMRGKDKPGREPCHLSLFLPQRDWMRSPLSCIWGYLGSWVKALCLVISKCVKSF